MKDSNNRSLFCRFIISHINKDNAMTVVVATFKQQLFGSHVATDMTPSVRFLWSWTESVSVLPKPSDLHFGLPLLERCYLDASEKG